MDAYDALALLDELLECRDEVAGVGRSGLGQLSAREQPCHEGSVVDVHALAKRLLTEIDHLGYHRNAQVVGGLQRETAERVRNDAGHENLLSESRAVAQGRLRIRQVGASASPCVQKLE